MPHLQATLRSIVAATWLTHVLRLLLGTILLLLTLTFTAQAQRPQAPQWPAGMVLLRGSLHAHSSASDSPLCTDPFGDATNKKNTASGTLNFLGLSDHGEQLSQDEWDAQAKAAERACTAQTTRAGKTVLPFIGLRGFEWTATWGKKTGGQFDPLYSFDTVTNHGVGHINIFGTDTYCGAGDDTQTAYATLLDWVADHAHGDTICQFNHPSLYDSSNHFDELAMPYKTDPEKRAKVIDAFALMELASHGVTFAPGSTIRKSVTFKEGAGFPANPNTSNEYWFRRALINGWRVAPSLGEDNHKKRQQLGKGSVVVGDDIGAVDGRTGVWLDADAVARDPQQALLQALRDRRTYSTEDNYLTLYFYADTPAGAHPMGSMINVTEGTPLTLHVELQQDKKKALGTATLVTVRRGQNPATVSEEPLVKDSKDSVLSLSREVTPDADVICYYIKTRMKGDKTAISAPIWPIVESTNLITTPKQTVPTTTVLVIDCSGSMSAAMPDGSPKLDAAITAARHYLDIIDFDVTELGASHQIGIVSFSSDATPTLSPTSSVADARASLAGLQPQAQTNYGDALDMATRWLELSSDDTRNIMVFLTDGMTNTGPVARDEFLVDSPDAFLNPLRLYQRLRDKSIKVFTVGFGDPTKTNSVFFSETGLDDEVLSKIATVPGTGGRYLSAASAFELDEVYIRSFHDATGQVIFESTGVIEPGGTVQVGPFDPTRPHSQLSGCPARRLAFVIAPAEAADARSQMLITLSHSGGTVGVTIQDPTGRAVDAAYPGAHLRHGMQPMCIAIDNPIAGKWQATLTGAALMQPERYQLMVSARTPSHGGGGAAGGDIGLVESLIYLLCGGIFFMGIVVVRRAVGGQRPRAVARPMLQVELAGQPAWRLPLDRTPLLIGRDRRNHLVLSGQGVAPFHAELRVSGHNIELFDYGSEAGTFVDGQRVQHCRLVPGNRIGLGGVTIVYFIE